MIKLELINGGGVIQGKDILISKGLNNTIKFTSYKFSVKPVDFIVTGLTWQENLKGSNGKLVAGGVVGGMLLGPLGIAAGALIGGKKKDKSIAVITVENGASIYVRCTEKEYEKLSKILGMK